MNGIAAGRIAGVPVYFDMSFALLVFLYASPYLRPSSPEHVIIGVFVVAGGIGSILLHELAHALAARRAGVRPLGIELHGFGGACHYAREPNARGARIFISLAGPAANLALWGVFHWLASGSLAFIDLPADDDLEEAMSGASRLAMALYIAFSSLSSLNLGLLVFNLLPSFPLDGGKALAEVIAARFDLALATQVVGTLGFGVCAWCLYLAFASQGLWMLLIAWSLFVANQQALETLGRRRWSRWN